MWGFPGGSVVKNLPANARDSGDMGLMPGSGRSLGEGNGNPNPILEWKGSLVDYSPWICKRVRHDLMTKEHDFI